MNSLLNHLVVLHLGVDIELNSLQSTSLTIEVPKLIELLEKAYYLGSKSSKEDEAQEV